MGGMGDVLIGISRKENAARIYVLARRMHFSVQDKPRSVGDEDAGGCHYHWP